MNNTCSTAPPGARFNLQACKKRTQGCDFYPYVPYKKCEIYCGSSFGPYDLRDVVEALVNWVLPLFGVLANMHFVESKLEGLHCARASRIFKRSCFKWLYKLLEPHFSKHFDCSLLLANPIGSMWNLTKKLDLGQQLFDYCNERTLPRLPPEGPKIVANLCYRFDEFDPQLCDTWTNYLIRLLNDENISDEVYQEVEKTSRQLALARVRNTRRSVFAILVYVGLAIVALLSSTNSDGLDYALPHTVALRELCFFILAIVVLSSAAGTWSHGQVARDIMRKFAKRTIRIKQQFSNTPPSHWYDLASCELVVWKGGSYLFRPQKSYNSDDHEGFRIRNGSLQYLSLLVLSAFVVMFAFIVSFTMSYLTPTRGVGGRGLMEILYITVWVVNFLVDLLLTHVYGNGLDRKKLFVIKWLKDGILSTLLLFFFFLPFVGKSCRSQIEERELVI